jgi:hypothetical protein
MAISKQTWEKIIYGVLIAITVGIAKHIYRKLSSPANHIFLAVVNLFYSIFVFLLLMSFVAGRIKVISETFPQFRIFANSWLLVPFGIVTLAFTYIFLILLLRWYFEKTLLAEMAETVEKSIGRGVKAVTDTVAVGAKAGATVVKAGAAGAKKAAKKTGHGAAAVTRVTVRGVGKGGSSVKKIITKIIRKPVGQKPEQKIDSAEDTQNQ